MGLVFALQPDLRRSQPDALVVRSTKKKFGLGGSFVFGGALLGTMFVAAQPLFKLFWTQGGFFDRLITIAVMTPIVMYPLLALLCWFYEERFTLRRRTDGRYDLDAAEGVFGIRWNRRSAQAVALSELSVDNWTGSRNVAALSAAESGKTDRYGTRGHWMLNLHHPGAEFRLERRAKREEVELLKAQIEAYFAPAPTAR